MDEVTIIGVDLAKSVFQIHGAAADGRVVFRKKLSRAQLRATLQQQPPCLVAMEACGSAHYWGREIAAMGHAVRLIAPCYVKPFVKRQKNDAADAEAIAEAVVRPSMRFVAVKTEDQQAQAMVLKTRDLLVRQRNQIINALRGHLMEYGVVAPAGRSFVTQLAAQIGDSGCGLPVQVVELCQLYLDQIDACSARIARTDSMLKAQAAADPEVMLLRTAPGVGLITALAIKAFAPAAQTFRQGRDFAAWLGLVPVQASTGGRTKLGRTSKMGQRDIRRLLIIGAMSQIRWALRPGVGADPWLVRMLACKPRLLVAIALANKTARRLWAMMTKQQRFMQPVA